MLGRRNYDQFIAMNHLRLEPIIIHWKRHDAEVHYIFENRFQNPRVIGALDTHGNVWIVAFKLREHFGQNVEASAFIGTDDNFAAGHALGLGNFVEDSLALLDRLLSI